MTDDCLPPWNTEPIDVDLRIVIHADMDGWWTIERAEHDGRVWTEGGSTTALCASKRIEKTTSIEGADYELLRMIASVKTWTSDSCKRWAIETDGDTALVWSPRNSETSTRVTRRALEAMVAEYEARTGGVK